jgi:protein-disulfide isomerase
MRTPLAARRSSDALAVAVVLATLASACKSSGEAAASAESKTPAAAAATAAPAGGEAVPAPAGAAGDSIALRAAADSGRILGATGAKVWILMASDFQCPYCKMWHDQSFAALRKEYVESGKVRMAFMNFPLDQHVQAMPAAEAAMCASAQGKFWPYHTALFESQADWEKPGDQSAKFEALATKVGVDVGRYRSCTQSHVMRALIMADRDRMATHGVQSTPSFFIGAQTMAGALPTDEFRRAIDAALAKAR